MELCYFTLIGTELHPRRGWVSRYGISRYLGYGYYPVATTRWLARILSRCVKVDSPPPSWPRGKCVSPV